MELGPLQWDERSGAVTLAAVTCCTFQPESLSSFLVYNPRLVSVVSSLQIWLRAFKAMLGEATIFDDLTGGVFDTISVTLFVLYLLIMTVMMLNLLIAVLSTAHARIDSNTDREYKVRQSRVSGHIEHQEAQHGLLLPTEASLEVRN